MCQVLPPHVPEAATPCVRCGESRMTCTPLSTRSLWRRRRRWCEVVVEVGEMGGNHSPWTALDVVRVSTRVLEAVPANILSTRMIEAVHAHAHVYNMHMHMRMPMPMHVYLRTGASTAGGAEPARRVAPRRDRRRHRRLELIMAGGPARARQVPTLLYGRSYPTLLSSAGCHQVARQVAP